MGMSDLIAEFIGEVLDESDGLAELQRAELANRFGCVPSQINYVISTRFSPEHGYIVESRRGGGGYIRIQRVQASPQALVMHTVNAIGDVLDAKTADAFLSNLVAAGALDNCTARLMGSALGDPAMKALPKDLRNTARASVLKQMLLTSIA